MERKEEVEKLPGKTERQHVREPKTSEINPHKPND